VPDWGIVEFVVEDSGGRTCTVVSLSNPAGAQHTSSMAQSQASADKRVIVFV